MHLLARASARLGRDEPARNLFGRLGAAAMVPEDHYLLGLVMNRLGKPDLALDTWELAGSKGLGDPEALDALATTYRGNNRSRLRHAPSGLASGRAGRHVVMS